MSNFRKNLKDNIVAPYNKYNLSQEKLAEILDTVILHSASLL